MKFIIKWIKNFIFNSQYKDLPTKPYQSENNNNKIPHKQIQNQLKQNMYATSSNKAHSFESYSPDLIQRELNSRFLQTTNNYTDKNSSLATQPTATTTNSTLINPLLQPYLGLNEFAAQSLYNPMVNIY